MGKIWMPGGSGGGIDPDELTALPEHVLSNKTAGVHGYDDPQSGTMPNRGAVTQTLNAGTSYTVPAGYHNGQGKVTANSLASQTPGNAHAGAILAGHSAWVNGSQVSGGIPSYGGQTVAPQTYAQTLSIAGRYNTGNVVVNPFPLPPAEYIKKGVNWYGVVGTANGWVAEPTDLYLYGNNISGFRPQNNSNTVFESGQISYKSGRCIYTSSAVNLSGYNNLNVYFYALQGQGSIGSVGLLRGTTASGNGTSIVVHSGLSWPQNSYQTQSLNISAHNISDVIGINISSHANIFRIWLS